MVALRLLERVLDLSVPGWHFVVSIAAIQPTSLAYSNPGFYAPAFPKYQQKDISGFLTTIWQSDPSKAKWSILAKAYSVIRDSQGKDITPLDQFLAITGPLIGIIKPEYYLQAMGWEIIIEGSGRTIMNRYNVDIDEHLFVTNLSVNDIIRRCSHLGFFIGNVAEILSSENEAVMVMASSAQRTKPSQPSIFGQGHGGVPQVLDNTSTVIFGKEVYNANGQGLTAEPTREVNHDSRIDGASGTSVEMDNEHETPIAPQIAIDDGASANSDPTYMVATAPAEVDSHSTNTESETAFNLREDAEVTKQPYADYATINPASGLSADNFHLTSEYPHNAEFDPDSPGFIFDPFLGNHSDVFDMSDLSWNDVIDHNVCS